MIQHCASRNTDCFKARSGIRRGEHYNADGAKRSRSRHRRPGCTPPVSDNFGHALVGHRHACSLLEGVVLPRRPELRALVAQSRPRDDPAPNPERPAAVIRTSAFCTSGATRRAIAKATDQALGELDESGATRTIGASPRQSPARWRRQGERSLLCQAAVGICASFKKSGAPAGWLLEAALGCCRSRVGRRGRQRG